MRYITAGSITHGYIYLPTGYSPQCTTALLIFQNTKHLTGERFPRWVCFPPTLTYNQPLIARAYDVFNLIFLSSTTFLVNIIKLFPLYVDPPAFLCNTCTTCLFHPYDLVNDFFPPTYKTCALALFQKLSWVPLSRSVSVNTQSTSQQILPVSLKLSLHVLPGQNLLAWQLHFLPSAKLTSTFSPTTPFARCQNRNTLLHLT